MSRTSSERGRERADDAFRPAFAATVVTLAVLCLAFLALGYFQGPKLSDAQVDPARAVSQGGQQLRLFANQQVAEVAAESVTITPAVPFSVTTSGDLVAVQFENRLLYDARYVVEVEGVRPSSGGTASTLRYEFETASPPLYYLHRGESTGGERTDEIVRTSLTGSDREVLYSAEGIQDFVPLGQSLVVATAEHDGTSALALVSLAGRGVTESLALPGPGTVGALGVIPDTSVVGFAFTSAGEEADRRFDDTLFTVDLEAGRTLAPVVGLDGRPLSVLDWQVMPQGGALVAQGRDHSVFLVDPADPAATVPLGTFTGLGRVSSDGLRLGASDPFGALIVTLADRAEERIAPSPIDGDIAYGGELQVLADGDRVQQVAILDPETGRFSGLLVADDGVAGRLLFRTVDDAGSIEGFAVSPNDQYVAIEVVPRVSEAEPDGNAVNPRPTTITTVFVEISSGAVVKTVEGFGLRW